MAVKGCQIHITIDLDFDKIADALQERDEGDYTEEQICEIWNNGELEQLLEDHFSRSELIEISGEDMGQYPLNISAGYMG